MNDGALFSEIETAIDVALSGGGTAPASWITQAVMDRHPGIDGPDAAWMENQARRYVRRCVQKVLSMAVGCQRHANEMRRYVDDAEARAAA